VASGHPGPGKHNREKSSVESSAASLSQLGSHTRNFHREAAEWARGRPSGDGADRSIPRINLGAFLDLEGDRPILLVCDQNECD